MGTQVFKAQGQTDGVMLPTGLGPSRALIPTDKKPEGPAGSWGRRPSQKKASAVSAAGLHGSPPPKQLNSEGHSGSQPWTTAEPPRPCGMEKEEEGT